MQTNNMEVQNNNSGLITLSIRLVIGWTYFSAFWRRLILENKLIPDEPGYIGEKFNHFLPNALGIKPIIEHLVTNPAELHTAMVLFTIIEGIVGLFIILGLFTRLMSIGIFSLAMGILLGSGWLGTTCLDEWQIGTLGIATGFTLFLSGSGYFSLDNYFIIKKYAFTNKKYFAWLASGLLPIKNMKAFVLIVSLAILGITLYTNQYFHGGVYGTLHNKSVKPKIEISNIKILEEAISFQIYRTEGADVYGSFLIDISIVNDNYEIVKQIKAEELATYSSEKIKNFYVTKVKNGKHSLIVPLGAKADIYIDFENYDPNQNYKIILTDISGVQWKSDF